MRIVYFGQGARGACCLDVLLLLGYDIACVVGQATATGDEPVIRLARDHGITVLQPRSVNSRSSREAIAALAPDLFVLAGFTQILKPALLAIPPQRTVNLHGGSVPEYRGASPVNWQIANGERWGGCTVLYADEGIDTGNVLAADYYEIGPNTTAGEAVARTLEIFPRLLVQALDDIAEGRSYGVRQDTRSGRYFTKRTPRDGAIDFGRQSDRDVHNLVRALNGPGLPPAFATSQDDTIYISETSLHDETVLGIPGRVGLVRDSGVVVMAANRSLLVRTVIVDGAPTPARDVLRRGETLEAGNIKAGSIEIEVLA